MDHLLFQNVTLVGRGFLSYDYVWNVPPRRTTIYTSINTQDLSGQPATLILETTLMSYGVLFLVSFLFFLFLRNRYKTVYNVNETVEEYRTPLSAEFHGPLSWMWKVFRVSDEEIFTHCGMDAVVFIRCLRYGRRVTYAGMLTSLFLLPLYAWSCAPSSYVGSHHTICPPDPLDRWNLGAVPNQEYDTLDRPLDPVFAAPVLAAYVVFGWALYLLLDEFRWYTQYQHRHLSKALPNNYTVYVKHIPPNMRSDRALLDYFRAVFPPGDVVDARVALDTPQLDRLVAERDAVVHKLERAINVANRKGVRPRHRSLVPQTASASIRTTIRDTLTKVDSIDTYTSQLAALNRSITHRIHRLEQRSGDSRTYDEDPKIVLEESQQSPPSHRSVERTQSSLTPNSDMRSSIRSGRNTGYQALDEHDPLLREIPGTREHIQRVDDMEEGPGPDLSESDAADHHQRRTRDRLPPPASDGWTRTVRSLAAAGTGMVALLSRPEGTRRDAGFVSFRTLTARQSAIQMVHTAAPFTMTVGAAPGPGDIVWKNIGRDHRAELVGKVTGSVLTMTLCLFWTFLTSFVTILGKVDSLVKLLPFLEKWTEKFPQLGSLLLQVEPLILVILISLLSSILLFFAKQEGLVSKSQLQASLFQKLSLFLIVQFFFVKMISSSVLAELQLMINYPREIVDLLARAVPDQSSSFMQYVLVQTFVYLGTEILRLRPILFAWIRSRMGPNLTEKERAQQWLLFRPLCISGESEFATTLANLVLFYSILLVYSVMSPVLNWIMCAVFFLLSMVYRHQVYYIYAPTHETEGNIFPQFVKMVILCIYVAEVTLMGVLGLKKSPVAVGLVFPLLVGTVFFNMYINLEHYRLTHFLPATMSVAEDEKNVGAIDFAALVSGKYLQPSLQKKIVEPESVLEK